MSPPPQRANGHPVLRNGLLFGAILGALGLGNALIQWLAGAYVLAMHSFPSRLTSVTVNDTGATSLLGCAVFLATLALTGGAGMLAARRSAKGGAGALAGLLAGGLGGLIGNGGGLFILLALVAPGARMAAGSNVTQAQIQALIAGTTIVGTMVGILVDAGVGAGMGALGGLVGASRARPMAPVGAVLGYPHPGVLPGPSGGAVPPTPYPPAPYAQGGYSPTLYPPPGAQPPPQP